MLLYLCVFTQLPWVKLVRPEENQKREKPDSFTVSVLQVPRVNTAHHTELHRGSLGLGTRQRESGTMHSSSHRQKSLPSLSSQETLCTLVLVVHFFFFSNLISTFSEFFFFCHSLNLNLLCMSLLRTYIFLKAY